jgi:hypothetical protein
MTSSQFYALMIARRAMGDLSREVELTDSGFDELVETSRGKSEPINPFEVRSNGWFQLNSCNGPTLVFRSGMRPELYFKYRAASSTTKQAARDKTTEEVIAERFERLEGELKHLKTIDEAGRRNAHDRITECEKRHAALFSKLCVNGVLSRDDNGY